MITIFDLDDTLYSERTFVESGFRAVAAWLERRFGWSALGSYRHMVVFLDQRGRGDVFDSLLEEKGKRSRTLVADCVRVYRHHVPAIALYDTANRILEQLDQPLYIVTDGHKVVQYNKVCALGLDTRFRKIFITHRYGLHNAKPSTYCFELIRKMENCSWSDMAYIGDNPAKDFVGLSPLGVRTIRVLTGEHSQAKAKLGFEANYRINNLDDLLPLLESNRV